MLLMYGIFTCITLKRLAAAVWGNGQAMVKNHAQVHSIPRGFPDPHWIDEQALKPHDSRITRWVGMARHGTFLGDLHVNFSVCVLPWCVFLNQETEIQKTWEKNSYSYTLPKQYSRNTKFAEPLSWKEHGTTCLHNPSTSWKKDRLILIIPRMDPRLLHVTW